MRILILEAAESDETILEDVLVLLSDRMSIQVVDLSHDTKKCNSPEPQVLTFSDLEIHVREQAVYKAGVLIPMSHYEFFTLCYLENTLAGCFPSNRSMRRSGRKRMVTAMPPSPMLSVKSERN